jgi:transposase-like protein
MNLNDPIFSDEAKALAYFEAITWPNGPVCPHCGETKRVYRLEGKSHRPGLIHCNACDGSFTVRTGGIMESSHVPLTKWALGFFLMASSKKGVSAHQLMRTLGLGSYRTAWFMSHRIREAMGPAKGEGPVGGGGKIVEADETEIGGSHKTKKPLGGKKRANNKRFVSLVERDGKVRSAVIDGRNMVDVRAAVRANLDPDSILHTDGAQFYKGMMPLGRHEAVDHNKQFVRKAKGNSASVHTNTAEGYFSLVKRGIVGTFHHVSPAHLPRYLNEFDFRMSNRVKLGVDDTMRTERAIKGAPGKRLTYHQPDAA